MSEHVRFADMVLSDTSSDLGSLRKVLNDNTTDVLDVCWRKLNKKKQPLIENPALSKRVQSSTFRQNHVVN